MVLDVDYHSKTHTLQFITGMITTVHSLWVSQITGLEYDYGEMDYGIFVYTGKHRFLASSSLSDLRRVSS